MNFKNKQIILRYISYPAPKVFAYLVEKRHGTHQLVNEIRYDLEPYQVEGGIITDYQVIANKIIDELGGIGKGIKDGAIVIYDTPMLLRFNTILPKIRIYKAKALAKNELNYFFNNADHYAINNRIVNIKDRGRIFYHDLISESFIKSLEDLLIAMDRYIDLHTNFIEVIGIYFEEHEEENTDSFVVYQDDYVTHVILFFQSKIIDALSLYHTVGLHEIVSSIELLRNKHLFSFEKRESNKVLLILNTSIEKDEKYFENLKTKYFFDVKEKSVTIGELLLFFVKKRKDFQEGFNIKLQVEK